MRSEASTSSTDDEAISLAGVAPGTYFVHITGAGSDTNTYSLNVDPGSTSDLRLFYVNDGSQTDDVYSLATGDDANDGLALYNPTDSCS